MCVCGSNDGAQGLCLQHKRNIKPEFKDDGAFWMLWDDFRVIFTDIDIARFFPYNWCVLSLVGKASKTDVCEKNTFLLQAELTGIPETSPPPYEAEWVRGCFTPSPSPPGFPLQPWRRVNQPVKGLVFSLGQNDPLTSVDHVQRKNGQLSPCTVSCYVHSWSQASGGGETSSPSKEFCCPWRPCWCALRLWVIPTGPVFGSAPSAHPSRQAIQQSTILVIRFGSFWI